MQTFTLKVIGVTKETTESVTVTFKQPTFKKVKYIAGQYITLIFRINGRRYFRPYSLSSNPITDIDLSITVKRVSGGIISNHILDKLKVGDLIEVLEPMGNFCFDPPISNDTCIYLWCAGSGITPIISILKTIVANDFYKNVNLIYSNKTSESTIFGNLLNELSLKNSNLKLWLFYTQMAIESDDPNVFHGRIDTRKILDITESNSDIKESIHFICGPEGLKQSIKTELSQRSIESSNIFSEDFEVAKDPELFKEILTRDVIITKGTLNSKVEVIKGSSILEAGLDAMLELSYSCQTGDCNLCKGLLTKGKLMTLSPHRNNDLQDGEYLLCCSYPLTDDVSIFVK